MQLISTLELPYKSCQFS